MIVLIDVPFGSLIVEDGVLRKRATTALQSEPVRELLGVSQLTKQTSGNGDWEAK